MSEKVNFRKLLWPTPLAILAAALANLLWYFLAGAIFPQSVAAAKLVANEFSSVIATIVYWIIGLSRWSVWRFLQQAHHALHLAGNLRPVGLIRLPRHGSAVTPA